MAEPQSPPQTSEDLRAAILERYEGLSKRLQQIARYVLDEPNTVALETLAVISERAGVQPSAIVRFAKAIGFEGASQMQRVFRDGLIAGTSVLGYSERVRQFAEHVDARVAGGPADMLSEFIEGNVLALKNLGELLNETDMRRAVQLISDAETVYVVGFRRSFPIASYLVYSLQQVDKKSVFVDGIGGLARQQVHSVGPRDLLIAVSYFPYAEEAIQVVDAAISRRAKVLAISDSLVSPIAKPATQVLQVRESEIRKFRSLAASMCLAQALVIAYAFAATQSEKPAPPRKGSRRAG